jgi:hypothetical protein
MVLVPKRLQCARSLAVSSRLEETKKAKRNCSKVQVLRFFRDFYQALITPRGSFSVSY